MRHAKSDWSVQGLADFDRTINLRGQKNAKQIGEWMTQNNFLPHEIISSSAVRARQTIELLVQQSGSLSLEDVQFDKDLYLASMDELMECIQLYRKDTESIMLVAHNPGIEQLVNHLVHPASRMINITTANLAIIEFTDCGFDPEKDKGALIKLIRPKELD